jgi:hypothetical protein
MATEFSNGKQTVKLYRSVNRGKEMYQLAFYQAGRRVQKNFSDKAEAKRVAKQILGELTNDAVAVEAMATPELESLIAAKKVLVGGYALHVAVEEHAQAVTKLGKATLREAVEFFLRHHRADTRRKIRTEETSEPFHFFGAWPWPIPCRTVRLKRVCRAREPAGCRGCLAQWSGTRATWKPAEAPQPAPAVTRLKQESASLSTAALAKTKLADAKMAEAIERGHAITAAEREVERLGLRVSKLEAQKVQLTNQGKEARRLISGGIEFCDQAGSAHEFERQFYLIGRNKLFLEINGEQHAACTVELAAARAALAELKGESTK